MSSQASRVPDLLLEQLALGEIDKKDERWLRAHLSDAEIEARLSALREADEALGRRLAHDGPLEHIRARRRIAKAAAEQWSPPRRASVN